MPILMKMLFLLTRFWWGFRQVMGDAAYDRYLLRTGISPPPAKALSREEFYLDHLRRRYSGVSRCC